MKFKSEERKRSITKMITCKVGEILISAIICQVIFQQTIITLGLPILLEIVQMSWYYLHERVWLRIQWAKGCESCHYFEYHKKRQDKGLDHD